MYSVNTIKKALGKRRMAKVEDFDVQCGYDIATFDILMAEGWSYDGGSIIVFEALADLHSQADVIKELKYQIDSFDYTAV